MNASFILGTNTLKMRYLAHGLINCKSTEVKKVLPHYINPLIIMFVKIVVVTTRSIN